MSAAAEATPACACGSGLTPARCCALDRRAVATEFAAGEGAALQARMCDAIATKNGSSAQHAAIAVLEEVPGHREALHVLFNMLRESEQWEAAGAVVDRLAGIHLNDPVARAVAVQFFLFRLELPRAHLHARMLLKLAPEAVISHLLLGRSFLGLHNAKAAEHHFRTGLTLPIPRGPQVDPVELEGNVAVALRRQGRFAETRAIFARLTETNTRSVTLLMSWAEMEEAAGDIDTTSALLDRAEAIVPGHAPIAAARASLFRRMKQPDKALAVLDAAPAGEADAHSMRLLQKGQTLDAMGRYDEAFEAFSKYKAQLRAATGLAYRSEDAAKLARALREFFTPSRHALFPRAVLREDSPQPIFIIGFPRSGTTLVEQTLSSHPSIAAGDELPIIGGLTQRLPSLLSSMLDYPRALSELWIGDRVGHIDTLRDLYLNEAAQMGATDARKRWFTDKMPLNETHLGLIHLLFPKSPIIHLVRHPLDVVLSVFSNALTHGFFCAYALETAAQHYALIADLIAHYRTALPLNYHAVRYEELVADQEGQVRGVLEFVGEPFDAATLAFHENVRPARTASYAQVTEKLYTRSVYRYRNYLKHLEPVIPILRPAIERLGYTVEA